MAHEEAVAAEDMAVEGFAQGKVEGFAIAVTVAFLERCAAGERAGGDVGADAGCRGLVLGLGMVGFALSYVGSSILGPVVRIAPP